MSRGGSGAGADRVSAEKDYRIRHALRAFPDDGPGDGPDVSVNLNQLFWVMKMIAEPAPFLPDLAHDWDEITIVETRTSAHPFALGWRPAVNAFRCHQYFVVFADLAGVPPDAISVSVDAKRLIIRGTRPAPEPGCQRSELAQLLALEIDHGAFERVLDLPHEVNPDGLTTEYRDGVLRIQLALKL